MPEPPLFPAEDRATIEGAEAWADSALQDGVRQIARWATGKDTESMATFLDGAGHGRPGRRHAGARCRCCGPVVALQMRAARRHRAGLPGGAARPARPRRRAARRGRDRRRAPERRRLPDRAVGAAGAVLRPAARPVHRRPAPRAGTPAARARLSRAASARSSRSQWLPFMDRRHVPPASDRRLALPPRRERPVRRDRPRPVGGARPAPARLRRALRRGRPRPRCCSTTATSAPAAASRASCVDIGRQLEDWRSAFAYARGLAGLARRPVRLLVRRRPRALARGGRSPRSPRSSRSAR